MTRSSLLPRSALLCTLLLQAFCLLALSCGSGRSEPQEPSALAAQAPPEPAAPHVDAVVDLHTDTPTQLLRRKISLSAPSGLEAGQSALLAGGVNTVVYVLWPPRDVTPDPYIFELESHLRAELAKNPRYLLVRDPVEWRQALDQGRIAVLMGLEGTHGLEPGGLQTLDRLYALGVRVLGLTWSFSTRYAGSSSDKGGGLSEEGRTLIQRANDLGMILDLSHASDSATLEACKLSRAPVIASHSNADGLRAHERNLSDEAIRCIAEKGGVIGVNLHSSFLVRGGGPASSADVAAQMLYLARIGGDGVVALGSDFDGYIKTPEDLPSAAHLPDLWAQLPLMGVTEAQIRAWKGENFARVWEAVYKARKTP